MANGSWGRGEKSLRSAEMSQDILSTKSIHPSAYDTFQIYRAGSGEAKIANISSKMILNYTIFISFRQTI